MKIIGIGESDTYIAEVSHGEIEKLLNLYYGDMKGLRIGEEVDISKIYEVDGIYRRAIDTSKRAMEEIANFSKEVEIFVKLSKE